VTKLEGAFVLDNADEFVAEGFSDARVPVVGKVDGGLDSNGVVELAASIIRPLERDGEDFGGVADELLAVLDGGFVLAAIAAIILDSLHHILLEVLGYGAVLDRRLDR